MKNQNQHTVKLANADRAIGQTVNLAVTERIFDDSGNPLSDSIIGTADCRIVGIGHYWTNQPRGESGRYYVFEATEVLPAVIPGRAIVLGI